jgi:methenyltetrahydromethanopterin cyclohydrolase
MSISINALTQPLVEQLTQQPDRYRIGLTRHASGALIVDAGIKAHGGLETGRLIAELCMGGLGHVRLLTGAGAWPISVSVHSTDPVISCLGSQYAGWSLAHGEGKGSFHALGSGPARALAQREDLFKELGYRDRAERTCIVLEADKEPPPQIIEKIVNDCAVAPDKLTVILTPTRSLAGTVQIVARVLEVALHKAHALKFALEHIVDGAGSAPLPPPTPDFVKAIGRTNDAILFAGTVQLHVSGSDEAARALAEQLPSTQSRDYGKPFAEIFKAVNYDFYQIDPQLFAPAQVVVSNIATGNTFRAGQINEALLQRSFEQ